MQLASNGQATEHGTRSMASRLKAARHAQFVGRTDERSLFRAALAGDNLPFQVLWVHGPGGIGKTSLLREFADAGQGRGVHVAYLDARNVEPAPFTFGLGLRGALGLPESADVTQALAQQAGRLVILVDTYEVLAPLDAWLRDTFLPQLSEQVLVVLAGRQPPGPAWLGDAGWRQLLRVVPLRNLAPEESRAFLQQRAVPADQHQAVLDFTHGHPLALSLVADTYSQHGPYAFRPEIAPDIVRTLVERLVEHLAPEQRAALEVCALVRATTEGLLAALLGVPDAHEAFEWLRELSFVESAPEGLYPHDLARDALAADLRWRHRDRFAELHTRAREYYATRLQQTRGLEQQRVLFDYVFLHRDNPLMRPYLEWQETGSTMPDVARPGEEAELARMVAAHEGPESARWFNFWFERQPNAAVVYRDGTGEPIGLMMQLALHEASAAEREADPATRTAWHYLEQHSPLRPGEGATFFRFWLARDTYQSVSALQSLVFGRAAQHYLATPGLAFSFFPVADPDFWGPMFAYADLPRLPEVDFEIDGRRYGVFAHDWRVRPPMAWLALLGERELASPEDTAAQPPVAMVVLSEPDFTAAVRESLRHFTRDDALRGNPLLRSRLVLEEAGAIAPSGQRLAALRALLRRAAEGLKASPRQAVLYRTLDRTYLQPAPSQEAAAEALDLPFSTYRRYLKAAVDHVTADLWQREVGGNAV